MSQKIAKGLIGLFIALPQWATASEIIAPSINRYFEDRVVSAYVSGNTYNPVLNISLLTNKWCSPGLNLSLSHEITQTSNPATHYYKAELMGAESSLCKSAKVVTFQVRAPRADEGDAVVVHTESPGVRYEMPALGYGGIRPTEQASDGSSDANIEL